MPKVVSGFGLAQFFALEVCIMRNQGKIRVFIDTLFAISAIFTAGHLWGDELNTQEIRGEDRVKPVSVLQNRYFLKQYRPELGVVYGTFLNEAYTKTTDYGIRGAFFISEWLGFEGQYLSTSVQDSEDRTALNKIKYRKLDSAEVISPDPEVNKVHRVVDGNIIIAPFYGKMNLVDRFIIYSDLYLTAGLAKVETDQGELNAFTIGAGERFYWKKSIAFRIDFRDRIYTEQRAGESSRKNSYSVDFGVSYFFL